MEEIEYFTPKYRLTFCITCLIVCGGGSITLDLTFKKLCGETGGIYWIFGLYRRFSLICWNQQNLTYRYYTFSKLSEFLISILMSVCLSILPLMVFLPVFVITYLLPGNMFSYYLVFKIISNWWHTLLYTFCNFTLLPVLNHLFYVTVQAFEFLLELNS